MSRAIHDNPYGAYGYPDPNQKGSTMTEEKLPWFQRWFLKHVQQAWKNHEKQHQHEINLARRGPVGPIGGVSLGNRVLNDRNSIDMSLFTADGGWIVQFTDYDHVNDRTKVFHYVIPDTEDFGPKLAEIITLQCLKK